MKPKPLKHKNENTFKFETFNDRLQKINISTINHLKRRFDSDEQDENLSYFAIALDKWQDLNCTNDYRNIRNRIGSLINVQTLVQIIHRKRELATILIDGLRQPETKALDAILELIVALARDLQSEFYEFFSEIFKQLVTLTNHLCEPELIEAIFVCETFLFKYLWKYILKDFETHFLTIRKSLEAKQDYVVNFTAEVFSFLLKKSTKQNDLIRLIVNSTNDELSSNYDSGVARILFEAIKGINHDFHSKTRQILDIIFKEFFVCDSKFRRSKIMSCFLNYLFEYSTQESFKLFWNYLLPLKQSSNCKYETIEALIPLINQTILFKKCKLIHNSNLLLETLVYYQTECLIGNQLKTLFLKSLETIINNRDYELSLDLVNNIFNSLYWDENVPEVGRLSLEQMLTLFKNVVNCSVFDIQLNKHLSRICAEILSIPEGDIHEKNECLKGLSYLVISKHPRPIYGGEIDGKSGKYILQFENDELIQNVLLNNVSNTCDIEQLLFSMIILPSLSNLNVKLVCDHISKYILQKIEDWMEESVGDESRKQLISQLLLESIITLTEIKSSVIDEISIENVINIYKKNTQIIELLQSIDIFLSFNKLKSSDEFHLEILPTLYPLLPSQFSSPYRLRRILSLHIASLFDLQSNEEESTNIFNVCLEAELIDPILSHYRDRLRYVRNLEANLISNFVPKSISGIDHKQFRVVSIFYLVGSLYENLNLLWKPTMEVLETYSNDDDLKNQVAIILLEHFAKTNELISEGRTSTLSRSIYEELFNAKCSHSLMNYDFKPDHYNHRCLLLKCFESFPGIIEPRNREFVDLFFHFIEIETKSRFVFVTNGKENLQDPTLEEDEDTQELIDDETIPSDTNGKVLWKTFYHFLQVFAKFKNPKAIYREVDLRKMYFTMLQCPNHQLQRHSMNCIFTYNYSYVMKYKSNFDKLLDEKTFSSEIHNFVLHDNEMDNIISLDDRSQVMPIFFRILYGKMLASSGTKIHGKSRIDFLRSIVLKVLSSFTDEDQIKFMELIFSSFEPFMKLDYLHLINTIDSVVNVEAFFMPFKQFQSLISTLDYLMKHFGSKSQSVMKFMFKILVLCGAIGNHLLSGKCRSKIKPYYINLLKQFRTYCFKTSQYFFEHFDQYPFIPVELDAYFNGIIRPSIDNLQIDSLQSPTPLLKLFHTWSKNPRFYILFVKHFESDSSLTPIDAIIQLYSNPKLSNETCEFITNIIDNLLTLDDDTNDTKIEINNYGHPIPKLTDLTYLNERFNFGSLILVPYIKNILKRIEMNYSINSAGTNKRKFEFTLQEVNVLARLSFFVHDPEDSVIFSSLLIYSISQTRRPEEDKEVFTLKTLNHLAKNINSNDFFKLLNLAFPLFTLINKPLSRRELCQFVLTLSEKNLQFKPTAQLLVEINSYNPRFLEEPDFDRRIIGFKSVSKLLEQFAENFGQVELDSIQILLENCAFFINNYEDLSLKDLSSSTILQIGELLRDCNSEVFNRYVINLIFYKIISVGFRQPKESTRHEYIELLMKMVKIFSHRHAMIQQLRNLSNESIRDEEVDFWRNIKHIQLHRRARALNRLASDSELLRSMSVRVYSNFLIPIATSFINDPDHYSKNVPLFTASIESLATYLQHCSWFKFDSTLSHYIHRLLNNKIDPKIAIRIISTLLGKFTFLKPEDVERIEASLSDDDFSNLSLEYTFVKQTKQQQNAKKFNNKKGKNAKKNEPKPIKEEKKPEPKIDVQEVETAEEVIELETIQKDLEYPKKIYSSLCKKLLPLLHKCLHQRSQIDYMHDSYKDQFPEDEEIQRIPIALAIVKLLKHIQPNKRLFEANLTSIFLRLCQFLQSRTDSIRETSRNTLVQIMKTLGTKYFSNIFYEMKSLLTRGYQRHIFIYTVYILLSNLSSQFVCGDLDNCLTDIIALCHQELFGLLSEEKEVSHIVTKTKEAKKLKSYDIYEFLGQFISQSALNRLLDPLKEVVLEANNHKVVKKAEEAFYKIGRGLVANQFLTVDGLVVKLLDLLSNLMPTIDDQKEKAKIESLQTKLPSKVDSFIIPTKSLRRVNQQSKMNRNSNQHVLVDFGLTCLLHLLKNDRLNMDEHRELMEQCIPQLNRYLHSSDMQVITSSLNCILLMLIKFQSLSAFESVTSEIISQIFVLLNKNSGLTNDNSQLITLCFKTISHFVMSRSECQLTNEQLSILLFYAEKDIENNSQNAAIYSLLKAIIGRRFVAKELHQLMERLLELAITTDVDHVRTHSIELSIKYLTDYPIESDRLKGKLIKLVRQLEYSIVTGRIAAITILKSVIHQLTYDQLEKIRNNLFVPIASRLVNEESKECKKLISQTVMAILNRIGKEDRNDLWNSFIEPWIGCNKIIVQTLASQLCSMFVKYEKRDFETRLPSCLPLIRQQLDPSRFSSLTNDDENTEGDQHKDEDNLIFQHLTFVSNILKLENATQILLKTKYCDDFNQIFNLITTDYLLHPHSWIRCLATQIFGQLFALWKDPKLLMEGNESTNRSFLFQNTDELFFTLGKKFSLIFRDIYNCESASEQLIKNMVYLASFAIKMEEEMEMNKKNEKSKCTLKWLINKIMFEVKFEVKNNPDQYQKRIMVFKWIAAVSILLFGEDQNRDRLIEYISFLLPPLCREELSSLTEQNTVDSESNPLKEELVSLNKQVLQLIRSQLGSELFIDYYNRSRNEISMKRLERRKIRTIEMATNSDAGVKRKHRKRKRDQVAKSKTMKRKRM